MNHRERLLKDIGMVNFALIELVLFLDTHPRDRAAIEYFNHYNKIKARLEREFSEKYFPISTDYAESNNLWRWGEAPLPWEGECV